MRDGTILEHSLALILNAQSNPLRRIPYLALFCVRRGLASSCFPGTIRSSRLRL